MNVIYLLNSKILLAYNQGFQYFSNLPVFHYLQSVNLIKIGTIFMNILHNTLKSGGTEGG